MTLEEAIVNAEAQAIRDEKEAERIRKYGGKFYDDEVQACLICAEQHRQLAEWLKELAERRKQSEVIRCGECVNFVERDFCKVAGRNVHRKSNCMKVFGAERRTDEQPD